MSTVLLTYPFFLPRRDRSVFRFPPLGLGYLAASLQRAGHQVHLLDCTFKDRESALKEAMAVQADVVGIYCMVTMVEDCRWFARKLRPHCQLLVAGGPLPTCDPLPFLQDFDLVLRGEAEETLVELVNAWGAHADWSKLPGLVYRDPAVEHQAGTGKYIDTGVRPFIKDLDHLAFPARHMFPNQEYIRFGKKKYGYSITTVMSTRGCPFHCEFCSNVVFGNSFRQRQAGSVVDEIEAALALGYDRIAFADDVFTLNRRRVWEVCAQIKRRGLHFQWECLGRVDTLDYATALEMKSAGCARIYFGIESGNDHILKLMKKQITTAQARQAVEAAHRAGLEVGAFFILFYPGESTETVLDTLRFATSLPLDYLGLTMPYPLPGTELYDRTRSQIFRTWRPNDSYLWSHVLIYDSEFSETKMWFGILKGHTQFEIKKRFGRAAPVLLKLFEKPTDAILRLLK
ncbi:MAG: radical SAM protein [Anaerolineales bacterium]|nr:MAG: radical SAM protein [Anaerolineales bacterium]